MKTNQQKIIVGIDLGSTMIRVAIGECSEDGIKIIGYDVSGSRGIRKGEVVNPKSAASAIREAIYWTRLCYDFQQVEFVVGIGGFICSQISHGEVRVKQDRVSEQDVSRVIKSAQSIKLPPNRETLHIIPCEYIIDKQTKTNRPLGLKGSTLEVTAHIITVESASIKNLVKACKLAGLKRFNVVLQSLATAEAVLLPDELEQNVALIDIGGATSNIAICSSGALCHTSNMFSVSKQLSCDLAVGLRIKMADAENIKHLHGCCLESMVDRDKMVEIERLKDSSKQLIPHQRIVNILEMRMTEVFTLIARELSCCDFKGDFLDGVVIVGGTSRMPGIVELAKRELKMPVRIGTPLADTSVTNIASNAYFSTAVGLALFGAKTDSVTQGIMVGDGSLWVFRACQAIRHLWRKFV